MSINTKKPAMKQTVGAQYMCFADATEGKEYDGTYEADVEKTEVVKSVKVTENSETSDVYASGKIYDSDSPMSSIDIEVSVIAFPDDTISKIVENSDDIATSEEKASEQTDTIKIRAYPFDAAGNIVSKVTESTAPEGLTEEKFFAKPILTDADLTTAVGA